MLYFSGYFQSSSPLANPKKLKNQSFRAVAKQLAAERLIKFSPKKSTKILQSCSYYKNQFDIYRACRVTAMIFRSGGHFLSQPEKFIENDQDLIILPIQVLGQTKINFLAIQQKSLDLALFLYSFTREVRSSGIKASITIVHIRKFYKL